MGHRCGPLSGHALLAVPLASFALLFALLFAQGCSANADAPRREASATGSRALGPVALLASFGFDAEGPSAFAGHSYEATCRLRLASASGDTGDDKGAGKAADRGGDGFSPGVLGALEEHVRYRVAEDGNDFHVLHEQRYDDRFVRQGSDAMEAVHLGGRLAVRRQREDFVQVANLHGEAARYREIGRGVLGALLTAFTPEHRREGDRILLGPNKQESGDGATLLRSRKSNLNAARAKEGSPVPRESDPTYGESDSPPLPSRPNDRHWEPHFRYYASAAVQRGFLLWPEGDALPRAGEFIVEATLNGHSFHADCAFVFEAQPGREGYPVLPETLPSLRRPRVQHDIDRVLRAIRPKSD
jgi:hypothetical protein